MKNPVADAIDRVGGPTKASFITQMSAATIYAWRTAGAIMDARAAVLLSRESGIPVGILAGVDPYDDNGKPE